MENVIYQYSYFNKVCKIIRSPRRTLAINVTPDLEIFIQAPINNCTIEKIQSLVHKRRVWIKKQLNEYAKFHPLQTPRKYVSGETHMYLGRQYRLKIDDSGNEPVKLKSGYFCLGANTPEQVKTKLNNWYNEKAKEKLSERLSVCLKKVPHSTMPTLNIRRMKKRWGSLSENGTMTLNTDLVKAPVDCIDYVIIHELCHQKYLHHGAEFWKFLGNVHPNWKKNKVKMEMILS